MKKSYTVSIDDKSFAVPAGARLLDAALQSGVDLQHDCRAGHCGACTVEVLRGVTLGGEEGCGQIRACQARVFSDLAVASHQAPHPVRRRAVVDEIRPLARGTVELAIRLQGDLHWLPGQYMKLQFRGLPARSFSPTARLDDGGFDTRLLFQIKQVADGLVTPRLGREIREGGALTVEGPFGHAFLRSDHPGRLVLLGSGTGFAPIWSIAAAALAAYPLREIVLICGARDAHAFYMGPALRFVARHPNVRVLVAIEQRDDRLVGVLPGTPADNIPKLGPYDIVYAAGSPRMVAQARRKAEAAKARFYADPFNPPQRNTADPGGIARLASFFAPRKLA